MRIERADHPDRDQWTVDPEDGYGPGFAWAPAGVFTDAEARAEIARQEVVLHRAFGARVRSLVGLELKR